MEKLRLDKFVSSQLNISRNDAHSAIRKGSVSVNGEVVRNRSLSINTDTDTVSVNGQAIGYKKYIYILMNKPAGVLSASNDKNRHTVVDLVPPEFKRPGIFPVGRLDKDTTGLLILTDDGDFAHKVISPKSNIPKCYLAELDGDINDEIIKNFSDGVVLADGTKCKPATLCRVSKNVARITITEGKYHQIKRMFGVFDLGVNSLHRESIGCLKLPNDLVFGQCVEILSKDVELLCL